jgi:general secretion pathway protein L
LRETLYIRLRRADAEEPVEYAVVAADAASREPAVLRAALPEVLAQAQGRRLIAFVPGADVHLTAANVPARQPAKVLQAVPFALEDQVAEDIDELHFAIGPRQPDGEHPVAITSIARMTQWMTIFRERGLRPEMLVPETLALPWEETSPGRFSALLEGDEVLVRSGPWKAFVCHPADLPGFLQLADPERAQPLRLMVPGDDTPDLTALDWPLELLPGFRSAFGALLASFRPEQAINLLQGGHSQRQDLQRYWRPWKFAAGLAAAWILVALTAFVVDTWKLGAELRAQDEANLQRFRDIFPSESRIVDLEAQLDQQLRLAASGGGGAGLFSLLDVLTRALAANAGLKVTALQYREGALFLSLTGSDLQTLEKLRTWFGSQPGTALEVQSANAGSDGVQIRLKVSRA